MLTLSRKVEEVILIGNDIRIVVKRIDGDIVKLGIEAPRNVPIYREEVFAEVSEQNREALKKASSGGNAEAGLRLTWPKAAPSSKGPPER